MEVTSEDAAHPIESALLPGSASGWRAAAPGTQTIRLLFIRPQRLEADLADLRGARHGAHTGIRVALVAGWWAVVPGNRAAAVELQPPRRNLRDGRPSRAICRRSLRSSCASFRTRVAEMPSRRWRSSALPNLYADRATAARRCSRTARRYCAGGLPKRRLNARLNAASDS